MNQLWIDKYKPNTIEEVYGNKKILERLDNYISNLKENPKMNQNVLITGPSGIGKTIIAHILFKKHNYRVLEYNSNNIEGNKTIKNIIHKSMYHGNVLEMFNQDNRTNGIIIDEFDSLIALGPKGGITELMSIIQTSFKSKNKNDKIKAPIIFTCKDITDKKLTELRKYTKEFKLKKPTNFEISNLIQKILKNENINMDLDSINLFIKSQNSDIRNIINNLCYMCSTNKNINKKNVSDFLNCKNNKDNDYQLFSGIKKIFLNNNVSYLDLENIYHMDTFFVPLLLYENYIKIIFTQNSSQKEKINLLRNISYYNSLHDIYHDIIFKNNYWELLNYMPYITTVYINSEIKKYKLLDNEINLNFRTIFTNISQYNIKYRKYVNIILNKDNNKLKIKDINFLIKIIYNNIKNNKDKKVLVKKLQYYGINYSIFIDIIRLNKNILPLLKKDSKQELMDLLNNN